MNKSVNIRIGGEAGLGLAAASDILAKLFIHLGYQVYSSKEYASLIKGGHNFHNIRISNEPIGAEVKQVDLLLAFDKKSIDLHCSSLHTKSIIVSDAKVGVPTTPNLLLIPIAQLEQEIKETGLANTFYLGAITKIFGLKFPALEKAIKEFFQEKPQHIERNIKAARLGYDFCKNKILELPKLSSKKTKDSDFMTGSEAISIAALKSGLTFHSQYPMTPASGTLHYLAKEALTNKELIVVQPEDEISVINFALGASFAGARAMTATSGGGFALMVESIGLAGMAEVPLVLIMGQRPGPSTGLPTKTEQGDLKFVLNAGTGDFPKVVIAPGDIEECYVETKRAFYLAEKYQLPVILLTDKYLLEHYNTFNLSETDKRIKIDFSKRFGIVEAVKEMDFKNGLFERYNDKKYLRSLPGTALGMYTCAGDEHDTVGEITEDPEIRINMMQRRMGKLNEIVKELPALELIGSKNASLTVVGWGSTKKIIQEAMEQLNKEGKKINFLNVKYMLPFLDEEVKQILTKSKKLVLIENNYSAQLGSLIRERTGIETKDKILRYDGKNFTVDELYSELKKRS